MDTEAMLLTIAKQATRLLKSWGVNRSIFVSTERPKRTTFWGRQWWWKPDFVFCLGDDEVGVFCGEERTVRSYCGVFIDSPLGAKRCCYTAGDQQTLNFPIHFFIALNAFAAAHVANFGGRFWFSACPYNIMVGYTSDPSFSLLLTIYSYRIAKMESNGVILKTGTLRQIMNYFTKVMTIIFL